MAREFGVSFSLGANLDGSFGSSFKAASDRIGAVTQALRDMERSPVGKVGAAMSAQKDKIKAQVAELKEARRQLAEYEATAERTGRKTKGLEQQIEKSRERVSRLTERAKSSGLNYRETVAAAVGSAGSYQAFGSQHQALGTDMEELRKRKDRESSRLFVARAADAQRGALSREFSGMPAADMGDRLAPMLAKQREAIKALGGNLREAETRLAAFQAKAKDSGGASGALALKLARAEEEVGQLSAKLMQSGAAYRETVALATSAGNRIGELASRYRTLSASMEAAKRHQQAVDANMSRRAALRDQRSDLNGRLIGGAAQAATAAIPVKLAVSAEDTFADLKKVMNGADDELLGQVYQDALKMSSETGKSFEDVVAIMTSGAQAGLGKTREEMRSNTEQAIQMSIAWGVTAEQAGDSLATWRSSMGMTSQEARHTADVINALSNEMNGEAGEIDRIFTRMGPLLKGSGMASQDIAALGMAFKASGAEVEVAGTAMKNFTNVLALGNSMTKDQKEIFSRLGLDPKAMQKQMQTDAKGAIMTLLKQIKRVPVERQNEVAMKLFGQESIAAIAPLLENLGLLKQAFEIANSNVDDSVLEEYQNRMKTTATEEAKLAQQTRNLGITVGNAALPAYNAFLKTMSKGVGVITGFAKEYPNVTTALLGGVGALAALTVGGIVFGYAYNGLATTINAVKGGMLALRGATIANTAATRGGTIAALLNRAAHLSWADVGKGSVSTVKSLGSGMLSLIGIQKGTAIGMVWGDRATRAWEKSTKLLGKGLGALKFAFGPVGIAIAGIGLAAYWLIENWDVVGPYFGKAWDWICGKFKWAADFIKGIVDWVFKAVDTIAKKWTESETFKRNTADALNMNFGGWQGSTAEEGAAWVRTGNEKGKESLESPPDFVGPKPQDKAPDKPAGPKPMETAKQLPGMPTGDAPGGDFVDDSLPAPDFSGWGDEDGKKKKGKKGKGAGPVTVVSLDSGNKFSTVFIPAASKKDKDASKPVGTSVLLPSSSGDSETVAFSKAGQNLVGGLNKTFDRLPKLFDASLSKVSEPDIPPAVVNIPASSSSPQPAPRAIFHPVQRQDRSGSPFAVLKNALGAAPDQWSRTVGAKFGRDALPPVLPQTPLLLERSRKAPAQRQPEASGDIQIVQHFNIADAGSLPAEANVTAGYDYADVSLVDSTDVIGGINESTGESEGLELIDSVFPQFRLVPGSILAPRFSEDPAVAVVMAAKADGINGLFKAVALADIPTEGEHGVKKYTDVPAYKQNNNLSDELLIVCWPKVKLGDRVFGLATHLTGLISQTDADREGVPYASPSNKRLEITSIGYPDEKEEGGWKELFLGLDKCNYLNGEGIYTAVNWDGGMKSWGGRMSAYPSNTDPKDCQDAIRRFFNWYQSTFILTYFQKVDNPLTRRQIQTILKSEQIRLDGYAAREMILGGSISFDESDNPATDLIDGIARFHLRITPPPANREIDGIFEFDTDNLSVLFS